MNPSTAQKPARFTFDLDLGVADARSRVLTETRIAEMTAAARAQGHAAGLAEGENNAVAQAARALTAAAEKLGQSMARLTAESEADRQAHQADAVELAAATGKKLAGHLVERLPEAELAALIRDCLSSLEEAPHLVIRCHPQLCDAIRQVTEAQMAASGFAGKLIVMGDPDIALGDGRIEWVEGGIVRDSTLLYAEIDRHITQFLDARGIVRRTPPAPEPAEEA